MEVISRTTQIDFLKYRYLWIAFSACLLAMTAYLWFSKGDEKFGVDFRGGTELIVRFNDPVSVADIRKAFEGGGVSESIVQGFETGQKDFSIRLSGDESTTEGKKRVEGILKSISPAGYTMLKEDFVGPVIGEQIRKDAYYAIILSLIMIMVYVSARFEWRFAIGGVFAVFHDAIIAGGFCLLTDRPMSAGILAALLTIVGYSINDTIVIFDRIRENIAKATKANAKKNLANQSQTDLIEVMNLSLNETLSRTILTSMTAFFVVTTLWLFGGGAVSDLSFALMVGILVGTYSTIFIACPTVLLFTPTKRK